MPVFLFVLSALGFCTVLLCAFVAPEVLTGALAKAGAPAVVCLLAGLRLRRQRKIKATPEFAAAKQQADRFFYIRADIEDCLRGLPDGYRLKLRTLVSGFIRGSFRSFERVEIEGPLVTVTVDCIGHDIVARHVNLRDPPNG